MPNIGPLELIVVLIIALVVLGPKRLPDVGRSVGKGMGEFKHAISGDHEDDEPGPLVAAEAHLAAAEADVHAARTERVHAARSSSSAFRPSRRRPPRSSCRCSNWPVRPHCWLRAGPGGARRALQRSWSYSSPPSRST